MLLLQEAVVLVAQSNMSVPKREERQASSRHLPHPHPLSSYLKASMFSSASVPLWMLFPSFLSLPGDPYAPARPSLAATSPGRPRAHPPWQAG